VSGFEKVLILNGGFLIGIKEYVVMLGKRAEKEKEKEDKGKEKEVREDSGQVVFAEDEEAKAWVDEGFKCEKRKDYEGALGLYQKAADKGYPRGWSGLAKMYAAGKGVKEDKEEVQRLYGLVRDAAEKGDVVGWFGLGRMYYFGHGVAKDEVEAVKWWRLAAEQGYAGAQYNLGVMYGNGQGGLAKDDKEAVRLYRLAADQGHADAAKKLKIRKIRNKIEHKEVYNTLLFF